MNTQLQIHQPLQNLIERHAHDKSHLDIVIDALSSSKILSSVISGALSKTTRGGYVPDNLKPEYMYKVLDAKYWGQAFALGNFTELMPAKDRDTWHQTIKDLDTPAFDKETVEATIESLVFNSRKMFAQKVEGVFKSLSREHVTNVPEGFGTKIILYIDGFGSISTSVIFDLFAVIGQCFGVGSKYADCAYSFVPNVPTDGQWRWAIGNICEVKRYKKGTMHIRLHDDVKHKLNDELHYLYPHAIPESSRRRQKTSKAKLPTLHDKLLQTKTIDALKRAKVTYNGNYELSVWLRDEGIDEVLICLGGVRVDDKTVRNYRNEEQKIPVWHFDYDLTEIIQDIILLRRIPDKQAYQFYPTPKELAEQLIKEADIQPNQTVLEPSAGNGQLIDILKSFNVKITAVEISKLRVSVLDQRYTNTDVYCDDFITWTNPHGFDRIVMNPPFTKRQAFEHVKRAVTMLNPNGILTAIVPSGFKGDIGINYQLSDTIEDAFTDASVSVRILIATK